MGVHANPGRVAQPGHRVARSTIANILKGHGIEPAPDRPSSWRTFLAAHWGTIAAADFFTTEVWTRWGLVTYDTLFVIDLASRGCTSQAPPGIPMTRLCGRRRAT